MKYLILFFFLSVSVAYSQFGSVGGMDYDSLSADPAAPRSTKIRQYFKMESGDANFPHQYGRWNGKTYRMDVTVLSATLSGGKATITDTRITAASTFVPVWSTTLPVAGALQIDSIRASKIYLSSTFHSDPDGAGIVGFLWR